MKKYSLSALVAAGLFAGGLATSANAADLGGNCCADLEERVAELEATTARKGNRKVSLTVSGWVGEQVMWWDDGQEQNTYVAGLGTTIGTNVKFTGQATIVPGWSAGYVIHIEADGSDALLGINQDVADGPSALGHGLDYVQTLQAFWFVKSDRLGKVGVGLQSQASDNTAILVDGSGSLIPANYVQFDWGGFFVDRAHSTKWTSLFGCSDCNGLPENSVRYDTPTFGGFSASASWGEDDFWDVALRYAGEFSSFKVAAAAAYSETSSLGLENGPPGTAQQLILQAPESQFFQVGAYIQHVPTGLFLYGAFGTIDSDIAIADGGVDNQFFYIKGGLRTKCTPLGATVVYAEYENSDNDGFNDGQGAEVDLWGLGVVQEIDAAAMSMWLKYRHISGDVGSDGPALDVNDFDYVSFGALINF